MYKLFKILLLAIFTTSTLFAVSISTNKELYNKGESITIDVSGLPDTKNCAQLANQAKGPDGIGPKKNDCSWVGLFYKNDKSNAKHLLKYKYAGPNENAKFTFSGLTHAGEYEARVFYKNNFKKKGSQSFTVAKAIHEKIQLKTVKDLYKIGENISVTISGMPGNNNDWIGLFYAYDNNTRKNVVYKIKTNGRKDGTFIFPALDEASEYEVRAFVNGSYREEDYYSFQVIESNDPGSVVISEVLAVNAHTAIDPDFSKFSDYIELYNSGSKSINISGYKLSDKVSEPKWTIPNGTILKAHSHMIFWADDENISLLEHHTNFKLKSKGEAVALFDPNGTLIDSIEFGEQKADISCTKNAGVIGYMYPTPYAQNGTIFNELILSQAPQFSKNSGFYDASITVSLTAENGAEIYYTVDGSYPSYSSTHYTSPISINKTTVLRAMSVENGKFQSPGTTHTYFINESTTLPVVSITTDEDYLWDDMIGIYTKGKNGAPLVCSKGTANFMQDWKRPANIEFFDKDKKLGFNQEVNIEISGSCSRKLAQKSLNIKADDKYGKDTIDYKLFSEKDIQSFKSFKLRNSGQDWWKSMFRDAMIQQLIKDDLNIDYQAYEPSIVFLNGEYWGIHNIREKKNEDYLANNHPGLDPDKVDILYGYADVKEGTATEYEALTNYIYDHDLSNNENYNYVASKIDIDNFIDYQITQIFIANYDWPSSNIRFYKEQKEGAKWRWMMDDQDYGFNLFDEKDNYSNYSLNHNTLAWATAANSNNWRNEPWSTLFLRSLLQNDSFKNAFVARYNTLLNTTFKSDNVVSLINHMKSVIAPEMPRHIATWGDAGPDYANINQWNAKVDVMIDFAQRRPVIAKGHLDSMF